jgi:hypothetical protein
VAIAVVHWSGPSNQRVTVPWTVLRSAGDAEELARAIEAMPRAFSDFTAIGDAIDFTVRLLAAAPAAERRVIDVSGDGANNSGGMVEVARDAAVAAGIVINGLPILGNEPGLEDYYRDRVIGGEGAFLIAAEDPGDFPRAMRAKLEREIAGWPPDGRQMAAAEAR